MNTSLKGPWQLPRTFTNALGKAEAKLNLEMQDLRAEMERSRCDECGFTGYQHQHWCPKGGR